MQNEHASQKQARPFFSLGLTIFFTIAVVSTVYSLMMCLWLMNEFKAEPALREFAMKDFDRLDPQKTGFVGSRTVLVQVTDRDHVLGSLLKIETARQIVHELPIKERSMAIGLASLREQELEVKEHLNSLESHQRLVTLSQHIVSAGTANSWARTNGRVSPLETYVVSRDDLFNFRAKLLRQYPLWSSILIAICAV